MSIARYRITDGANGRPIISRVVVHGDTVHPAQSSVGGENSGGSLAQVAGLTKVRAD
jgi:hypothetical protein